jgi:zinc protease
VRVLALAALCGLTLSPSAHAIEVAFEHDSNLPLVYINLAVRAGGVSDPDGQAGITNFMGEMLMRGSASRTKEQIDLELDQMGAKLEVDVRAEMLIFRGAVLSSQLDGYLKLLTDLVTQPKFPEQEMRKLKSEIVSGILEETGRDGSLAGRRFNRFLFASHPYGNPVLGKVKDIESLTVAQVKTHYEKVMRDQRMVVIGTGDAQVSRLEAWAAQIAQARPGGDKAPVLATPKNGDKRRMLIIDKPDRTQTQIRFGQVGTTFTDPRFFAIYLGNHAFGGGSFSARLMVEIRVKRGWAYGASSQLMGGSRPRSWTVAYSPASKDSGAALKYGLGMVAELRDKGISQAEFQFARDSLINGAGFMYNTPKKRVENRILERMLELPDGFMASYAEKFAQLTLDDVNRSLKEFLHPDQLAIAVVATAAEMKGPLAEAAGLPADQVRVVPYTED